MSMDNSGALTGDILDPAVKPGIQTSEFWVAVATAVATLIVSILALFGHVVKTDNLKPIIGAVGILGPIIASAYYSQSRGVVKAAAHAAAGSMAVARLYQPMTLEAPAQQAAPVVNVHFPALAVAADPQPVVETEPVPDVEPPMGEEAAPAPEVPVEKPAPVEVPPDVPLVPMAEETGVGN